MAHWRNLKHSDAMRAHALRRLFQRHGIAITDAEYAAINAAIAGGACPALGAARSGGTLHAVELRGRVVHAVWDVEHGCVVTFLQGVPFEVMYPAMTKALSA